MLVYVAQENSVSERLLNVVRQTAPLTSFRLCRHLEEVESCLIADPYGDRVALFVVCHIEEVLYLRQRKQLLREMKKIVLVAQDQGDLWKECISLDPSYMTGTGGDFSDVGAVLGRLLCRYASL